MLEIQGSKCFGNTKKQLTFLKLSTSYLKIVCTKMPQKFYLKPWILKKQKLRNVLKSKNSISFTNDQNATEHWEGKILKKQKRETAIQLMTDVDEVTECLESFLQRKKKGISKETHKQDQTVSWPTIKGIKITLIIGNKYWPVCAFAQKILGDCCIICAFVVVETKKWIMEKTTLWLPAYALFKTVNVFIVTAILLKLRRPMEMNYSVNQILSRV